jgi:hypothetical protein
VTRVGPEVNTVAAGAGKSRCVDQSGLFSSACREISSYREAKTTKGQTIPKRTEPAFFEPMQCKPVTALPAGVKWTFEIKFDGWRCIAVKRGREVNAILTPQEGAQQTLLQRRCGARIIRGRLRSRWRTGCTGFARETLFPRFTTHYFTVGSNLLLRIRFTKPKWTASNKFASFPPTRDAGEPVCNAQASSAPVAAIAGFIRRSS